MPGCVLSSRFTMDLTRIVVSLVLVGVFCVDNSYSFLGNRKINWQQSRRTLSKEHQRARKETTSSKRSNVRVSFRECNLESSRRLDCGHYGITEESCYARECCWGETTEADVPWCYHSIPTISSQCLLDVNERQECGSYGIRKEQCLAKDCCWQPTNNGGVPWCFQRLRVPIFEGECGVPTIPPNVMTRIVGGEEAKVNSWPWMASFQSDNRHYCGGSLINNQWVVSAAHCNNGGSYYSSEHVVLGMHSVTSSESSQVRVKVEKTFPHENYGEANGYDNDIMLIKLRNPVNFTDAISPVCLPEQDSEVAGGRRCYATGWGTLHAGGIMPTFLQQVMVPIVENEVCNKAEWYDGSVDHTMICAGYEEGGRDSCQGDSGGPLVCYEDQGWVLRGATSWGYGCASERKPGIYSKIALFNKWIEDTINNDVE